jgi:HD-GYP domain-containing protein (c-di-GMP phosphodiesterase class II)
MGALFHDVGELMLPAQQRESRLSAASDDAEHWKIHVDEGFAIVRGKLDPSAAAIVLHHHQRYDGGGFSSQNDAAGTGKPQRGQDIHVFARIVMAADLFCQTLFGTSGSIPQPMVKTLWQLQQASSRAAFDPVILDCLMSLFPPFAEGLIVSLSNHTQALVMKIDAAYPCYPVVQTLRQEHGVGDREAPREQLLDLAAGDVMIEAVDGFPVEQFLFGMRKGRPLAA